VAHEIICLLALGSLNCIAPLVMVVSLAFGGLLLLVGTFLGWNWLANPPQRYWWFWGNSAINRFFGSTALICWNYTCGVVLTLMGAVLLWGFWPTLAYNCGLR
jgi:hypothetical protein